MGNCISKKNAGIKNVFGVEDIVPTKEGELYSEYAKNIRPLDLVLFRGKDYISDLIRFIQGKVLPEVSSAEYSIPSDAFSHVGVIVTSEILDDDRLEDGKLYIWESTMSGNLTDGVTNIQGESYLGVQLRDFDNVVESYDEDPRTRIAVAHISPIFFNEVWGFDEKYENLKGMFTKIFQKYNGIRYDSNLISLASSISPYFRPIRENAEEIFGTEEWLFCSELVAVVYRELGWFSPSVDPKNVVPMDFIGRDGDSEENGGIPVIVENPVYIISEKWKK